MFTGLNPVEVVGWIGSVAVIGAYVLVTTRPNRNPMYFQLVNLAGALCLIAYGIVREVPPTVFLNVIWAGIAVFGIRKVMAGKG